MLAMKRETCKLNKYGTVCIPLQKLQNKAVIRVLLQVYSVSFFTYELIARGSHPLPLITAALVPPLASLLVMSTLLLDIS